MTKATIRAYREASAKNSAHAALIEDCLTTIEHLQSFTRRGELPDEPEPQDLPKKAKGKNGTPDPQVKYFIDLWTDYFREFHKEKYLVQGGKDGAAVKRLLGIDTIDHLLDTAWEAWAYPDKFNCKQAVTIAGFSSRYNEIKLELRTLANNGRPARSQPAGVVL